MRKTFTKKDLRNGDIVVTRSGEPGVAILDKEIIIYQNDGFDMFELFTDDLMSNDDVRQCDIMKVYQEDSLFGFLDLDGMIPVFEREEDDSTIRRSVQPESNPVLQLVKKETAWKKRILITAQAIYGNRTITRIKEEDMDPFILGYLDASLFSDKEKIDRTQIPIPGTDNLVLVYNKYQEEESIQRKEKLRKEKGINMQPLAVIPEMGLVLYSRCIVCRTNEKGEYEDLQEDDFIKFMQYLTL